MKVSYSSLRGYVSNRLGQDLDFKEMLVLVLNKAPDFLLIGHIKINFVSSTVFNVSCIDCTLSNCVSVLKPGMSVMGVVLVRALLL